MRTIGAEVGRSVRRGRRRVLYRKRRRTNASDRWPTRTARLSDDSLAAEAEAGRVPGHDPGDLGDRSGRASEAAAHVWPNLRTAARRYSYTGGITQVKEAVAAAKLHSKEVFVPLSHPAREAQFDFGEATVVIDGVECKAALAVMTRPYSDAFLESAFPRECTETFQTGHVRAFEFFGGVRPALLWRSLTGGSGARRTQNSNGSNRPGRHVALPVEEFEPRQRRAAERRLKAAKFPTLKSLDTFDNTAPTIGQQGADGRARPLRAHRQTRERPDRRQPRIDAELLFDVIAVRLRTAHRRDPRPAYPPLSDHRFQRRQLPAPRRQNPHPPGQKDHPRHPPPANLPNCYAATDARSRF